MNIISYVIMFKNQNIVYSTQTSTVTCLGGITGIERRVPIFKGKAPLNALSKEGHLITKHT